MAVLDNWLFICGGNTYGAASPLAACSKFDLNGYNAIWQTAPDLPRRRKMFEMVTLQNSMYISGGYDFWSGRQLDNLFNCLTSYLQKEM